MSRFSFESDYDDDDYDNDEDADRAEEIADELFLKDQIIAVQQENNDLLMMEVEQKLLKNAIHVAKSDWLWNFRSTNSKLRIIKRIFRQFKNVLDEKN